MDKKKQMTNGFTLIEILVAISIMAVIMAFAIPNYLGARERARDAKLKAEMNQLKSALRMYYNDYQRYPAHDVQSRIMGCGTTGTSLCPNALAACTSFQFSAGGTDGCSTIYMKKLPVSSYSSGEMRYNQLSGGDGFSICANLENTADQDGSASRSKCTVTMSGTTNIYCVCSD